MNKICKHNERTTRSNYGKLFLKFKIHCRSHSNLKWYSYSKINSIFQLIVCNNQAYFIDHARCQIHRSTNNIELILRKCPGCDRKFYFPSNRELCIQCGSYRTVK